MNQTEEKWMDSPTPEKISEKTPSERILSLIARLTSNSTDELDKAITELERLQEFLKSGDVASASNTRSNGRDKLKRWP
jgi:hypothetical protein